VRAARRRLTQARRPVERVARRHGDGVGGRGRGASDGDADGARLRTSGVHGVPQRLHRVDVGLTKQRDAVHLQQPVIDPQPAVL